MNNIEDTPAEDKAEVPDPMDAARWRLDQTMAEGTAVTKLLTRIPVRKPGKQEFVRVHPSENYRLNVALIELKEDREFYLVDREVAPKAVDVANAYTVYTTINRQGVVTLWPVRLPEAGGRSNDWPASSHDAADEATRRWVNLKANMSLGAYEVFYARVDIPDPEWPEHPFLKLLSIAFRDRMVTEEDHPLILKLRGML